MKRRKKEKQLGKEKQKKARQEEEEKIDAWREKLEQEADEKRRVSNIVNSLKVRTSRKSEFSLSERKNKVGIFWNNHP